MQHTITLGGVTTGSSFGLVVSGHAVDFETGGKAAHEWNDAATPIATGYMGKVTDVADNSTAVKSDTAFVKYSGTCATGSCMGTRTIEGNSMYTVTGAVPLNQGDAVRISGMVTGETASEIYTALTDYQGSSATYSQLVVLNDHITQVGDSGAPVFTVPDSNNEVRMLGVTYGQVEHGGEIRTALTTWDEANDLHGITNVPVVFANITNTFENLANWSDYGEIYCDHTDYDEFNNYDNAITTSTGHTAPSVHISGDGFCAKAGIQRPIYVGGLGDDHLHLSVDYRAKSKYATSSITNAHIEIVNSTHSLYSAVPVSGGTKDSGWNTHTANITDAMAGQDSVTVRLYLHDAWIGNYGQNVWFDDFHLGSVTPESSPVTAPPAFTTITDSFANTNAWSDYDETDTDNYPNAFNNYDNAITTSTGHAAPSVQISGDGYKSKSGIQRDIDLSELDDDDDLYISVDYRAKSLTTVSAVTNAKLIVVNSTDTLYKQNLVLGGTTDSGWNTHTANIKDEMAGQDSVTVNLFVRDGWSTDYKQHAWFDDFYLGTTSPAASSVTETDTPEFGMEFGPGTEFHLEAEIIEHVEALGAESARHTFTDPGEVTVLDRVLRILNHTGR